MPRLAVVDVETTGLRLDDRVVEVACVTMSHDGRIEEVWETLVNPHRDVGATWIHGITNEMVERAPTFAEIAASLADVIDGAILVAHNLSFDARMLNREFDLLSIPFDVGDGVDTLALTRCKLPVACERYGVELADAHRASADALATATLLSVLIKEGATSAIPWDDLLRASVACDGPQEVPLCCRPA